jgi:hypothetical protein
VGRLAHLQDELGKANDAATAITLLETLAPPRGFATAAERRLRWRMRMGGRAAQIAERIRDHPHFWKDKRVRIR